MSRSATDVGRRCYYRALQRCRLDISSIPAWQQQRGLGAGSSAARPAQRCPRHRHWSWQTHGAPAARQTESLRRPVVARWGAGSQTGHGRLTERSRSRRRDTAGPMCTTTDATLCPPPAKHHRSTYTPCSDTEENFSCCCISPENVYIQGRRPSHKVGGATKFCTVHQCMYAVHEY